jgi:hypothetical protein
MTNLPRADRMRVLRFASSFLWADLELASAERAFFTRLAGELGLGDDDIEAASDLLDLPPAAEDVDPARIPPALADTVRDVALRAIAADGRVAPREMTMFHLLDELLPRSCAEPRPRTQTGPLSCPR